ncbi:integration host factor subunit beta [Methylobacterium fujisawaense]|uniref:HU family DNA-binding protein n=1 Tax=Methylobacterium fujisawaense TaxID=107400 RepID=UPI002F2E7440
MIRSELILRIAAQNPHLYAKDVEAIVAAILDRVAEALAAGGRVELRDFGTFCVRVRDGRGGRNLGTGARLVVRAKAHIHFRPGKSMRSRINPEEAESLRRSTAPHGSPGRS